MGVRLTLTDCDEAGDHVLPNVLSPRDLVFRPDTMDETVLHVPAMVKNYQFCVSPVNYCWADWRSG